MTRALVYLNCDDDDCGYLFDQDTDEPRLLYTDCSSNQEPYVKGGNLEELMRVLTTNAITLWGGVPLLGPSPTNRSLIKGAKTRASEEQVIEFILATYATYTNAVVLMRLLIHRLVKHCMKSRSNATYTDTYIITDILVNVTCHRFTT